MRIFCIGMHRTGTRSLAQALRTMGIPTEHWREFYKRLKPENSFKSFGDIADFCDRIKLYDSGFFDREQAYSDLPVPYIYQRLDQMYPGSKFIYVDRPIIPWLESRKNMIQQSMHWSWVFGKFPIDYEAWIEEYFTHREGVRNYFKDREKDILSVELGEYGFKELFEFLGYPKFPEVK